MADTTTAAESLKEPEQEQQTTTAAVAAGGDEELSAEDKAAIEAAMAEDDTPQAKSLKCMDCGKLFKNADLANYHAEKSGHENFEESTEEVSPLSN